LSDTKVAELLSVPKRQTRSEVYEKPEPVKVTFVPPPTLPDDGDRDETTVGAMYVNVALVVLFVIPSSETPTATAPADSEGGTTHSTRDLLTKDAGVNTESKKHLSEGVPTKESPCTTTVLPPDVLPVYGETPVTMTLSAYK
jgi:hypothetical protein